MNWKKVAKYILLIIVVFILFKFFDAVQALKELKNISWSLFSLAVFFHILQQPLRAFRFSAIFGKINKEKNIAIHLITPILARVTPGKIGDILKIFFLRLDKKAAAFSFVIEKLFDFLILIILALPIVWLNENAKEGYLFFVALYVVGLTLLYFSDPFLNLFIKIANKISPIKVELEERWFRNHFHRIRLTKWLNIFFQSIVCWGINFIGMVILARSIGIDIPFFYIVSILSVGTLVGVISGLPGGFGAREGIIGLLLVTLGVSEVLAGAYSILLAAFLMLVEGAIGGIGWLWFKSIKKQESNFDSD